MNNLDLGHQNMGFFGGYLERYSRRASNNEFFSAFDQQIPGVYMNDSPRALLN